RGPSTSRTGLLPLKKSHLRADTLLGLEGSRARQWHGTPRTCTVASPRTDCVLFSDARSITTTRVGRRLREMHDAVSSIPRAAGLHWFLNCSSVPGMRAGLDPGVRR